MRCASAFATYTCSNPAGTTCTKVAITVPRITAATVCTDTDLVVLTGAEYAAVTAVTSPVYDYEMGAAYWAFAFTGVMILYFSSHAIGLVLNAVRKF